MIHTYIFIGIHTYCTDVCMYCQASLEKCAAWKALTLVLHSSENEAYPQNHDWANWFCVWICCGVTPKRKTKSKQKISWTCTRQQALSQRHRWLSLQEMLTAVEQVEKLLVSPRCQDAEEGGRSGMFTSSNWPIIMIIMSKLRGAENKLPWWKEISPRREAGFLVVELVTNSLLVIGVWTQHRGKYLTKAHTVKGSQ